MHHELLMHRCIDLARKGSGATAPNPLTGSVIWHEGSVAGEGYHMQFGGAHAEVNAIQSVSDRSILPRATLYVNLEPCSHFGKTPPCADMIIESGIRNVVVGMKDPNELVNGKGIERLRNAGVNVTADVCNSECQELNKRFICFHKNKRPYIILKWAESADGLTGRLNEKLRISNALSEILVHRWRSEEQAIMAGYRTLINDDPQLNVRKWFGKNPLRITIDKNGMLPPGINFFKGAHLVFTCEPTVKNPAFVKIDCELPLIRQVTDHLYRLNVNSVLVEGGAALIRAFIEEGLWDEARIFRAPQVIGNGVTAPVIKGMIKEQTMIGDNTLTVISK